MRITRFTPILLSLLALGPAIGCAGGDAGDADGSDAASTGGAAAPAGAPSDAASGDVVEVTAHDFAFQAPDTIAPGWTTFRFHNEGAQTHFFVLDHLPDGRKLADFGAAVAAPFDRAWSGLQAGTLKKSEVPALLGSMLPPWFGGVEQTGGVGLVAPGGTGQATVRLEPGTYVIECYVKTPDGQFHTSLGMARQLDVAGEPAMAAAPSADAEITFANGAMQAPAELSAGRHTVAVHYQDKAAGILANDVHVARLNEGQNARDLAPWMDWMNVQGLRAPAPATFLGGVQEVPTGGTAYFTVDLEAGRYTWISENAEQGMVQAFTVR